ncbi:MAG: NUDIX domain-containing protein [Candidatus Paceibacterota bacterium]|jgi:8-oxo-dGTP pyrophosphatase MutT (NUDIX family)
MTNTTMPFPPASSRSTRPFYRRSSVHGAVPVRVPKDRDAQETASQNGAVGREISSGIIVYRDTPEGPRFLVLYYGHDYWTFPRGKIAQEERSFAAAVRETREETGLTRADVALSDHFKAHENWTFVKNNHKIHKTVIFYLGRTDKKNVRLSDEHQGYCWLLYREALRIFTGERHSENRRVIRQAYEYITRGTDVRRARSSRESSPEAEKKEPSAAH